MREEVRNRIRSRGKFRSANVWWSRGEREEILHSNTQLKNEEKNLWRLDGLYSRGLFFFLSNHKRIALEYYFIVGIYLLNQIIILLQLCIFVAPVQTGFP